MQSSENEDWIVLDEDPSFEGMMARRLERHEQKLDILLRGQADLTVAFGRVWQRIGVLEQEAKWKRWVLNVGKAGLPFLGGLAVSKWPWLGELVSELLKAAAAP
jgi:hypothetical protein